MYTGYAKTKTHRNWWITADPVCDIGEYYRNRFNFKYKAFIKIQKPKWGYHITTIRLEEPIKNKDGWNEKNDLEISFQYCTEYRIGDNHIWFNIYSDDLVEIRRYFGLSDQPEYPFHLTLGYIENIYNLNWLNEQRGR